MPTYEYECRKCGHRFEVFQRIVDPPVRKCPKCKRNGSVEQIILGGSGLIFKGSGFYITDYARKSGPDSKGSEPGGKTDKPGSAESEKKSGGSTEPK
ncbi:MAG: FmdB family zinc ribbon protein [candidate division WOR-3 bacterium]